MGGGRDLKFSIHKPIPKSRDMCPDMPGDSLQMIEFWYIKLLAELIYPQKIYLDKLLPGSVWGKDSESPKTGQKKNSAWRRLFDRKKWSRLFDRKTSSVGERENGFANLANSSYWAQSYVSCCIVSLYQPAVQQRFLLLLLWQFLDQSRSSVVDIVPHEP